MRCMVLWPSRATVILLVDAPVLILAKGFCGRLLGAPFGARY